MLIDHLRGVEGSRQALTIARADGERLAGSVVTRTELLVGMRSSERHATARLIGALAWIPVDVQIADRAGEFGRAFRASHPGLGHLDLLIGATADVLEGTLWTRNRKHFPMFPGLRAPY